MYLTDNKTPHFSHRSYYINFAEHLQNAWNVNVLYPDAPNQWSANDWKKALLMMKSFGFNCFEFWLVPTLCDKPALSNDGIYAEFADTARLFTDIAHKVGLKIKFICSPNIIGPSWYFACPNDKEDKKMIQSIWRHWMKQLPETDIISIFPGDPGGCNRNGCNHEIFVDLALETTDITLQENPNVQIEIGTWGTPFSGWGSDMRYVPDWDGSWDMLLDEEYKTPEVPCHIWNGDKTRAKGAMEYLIKRLPEFPNDSIVAINLGFSPDCDDTMGGDAREYAREIAKTRDITTWDYSLTEGELINYPHWRLPRISEKRKEERTSAPYIGGMAYTMTPKLNLLTMYAAGQMFIDPDIDPNAVSREFCSRVFGTDHADIGDLFEAFEVVQGWGHYPRKSWGENELIPKYKELIERLKSADTSSCDLPLFPDPETYRKDLIWFAEKFLEMASPNPDREIIRKNIGTNRLQYMI